MGCEIEFGSDRIRLHRESPRVCPPGSEGTLAKPPGCRSAMQERFSSAREVFFSVGARMSESRTVRTTLDESAPALVLSQLDSPSTPAAAPRRTRYCPAPGDRGTGRYSMPLHGAAS